MILLVVEKALEQGKDQIDRVMGARQSGRSGVGRSTFRCFTEQLEWGRQHSGTPAMVRNLFLVAATLCFRRRGCSWNGEGSFSEGRQGFRNAPNREHVNSRAVFPHSRIRKWLNTIAWKDGAQGLRGTSAEGLGTPGMRGNRLLFRVIDLRSFRSDRNFVAPLLTAKECVVLGKKMRAV